VPRARIIHRFGRADQVDREALARLVRLISRFLDPTEAVAATASGEVSIVESRTMGSAWVPAVGATVSQRTELTPGHRRILTALSLPEPPRFYDFTPAAE
jgi:hypothetical protein